MILMPAEKVFELMNSFGCRRQPFLFGIDFDVKTGFFVEPEKARESGIYFNINGVGNNPKSETGFSPVVLNKHPVQFNTYEKAYSIVRRNLLAGNSYLTNLTFQTEIELNHTLSEIFARSNARYRLLFGDDFVVFSPEIFVQIADGKISSFPMKGTIDASIPGAEKIVLSDLKETAEHNTIVDLIRNDLSMVASDVNVERFRYVEKINTNEKSLYRSVPKYRVNYLKVTRMNWEISSGSFYRQALFRELQRRKRWKSSMKPKLIRGGFIPVFSGILTAIILIQE
jgi:para-aminobenzoate synthetase component 1